MTDLSRLNAAFDRVVDRPAGEREEAIREACGGDGELEGRLRSLLHRDGETTTPLDSPFEALVAELLDDADDSPETIGPYRILGVLGRGGMGSVYLAERSDGAYRRRVAIKLVKRGMDSDEVLRRFRSERQILADLEHPNIAALFDGGIADDGRPYLVMEVVDGKPITLWADERQWGLRARIRLFLAVCGAVQFAHRNLVVHRDLKPSNIFVDDRGEVKLLDFGVAKLLDGPAEDHTRVGDVALTPAYAAPEQSSGAPVTTATDVFGLGVVLHELLTGARPSGRPGLRPSAASGRPALRGDLDAILLRALEEDPGARYPTVDALVDDLQRALDNRPVAARKATRVYRAGRFLRRHWRPVAGLTAGVAALVAGLTVVVQQRNLARVERDRAEALASFLEGTFQSVNPVGGDPGADTLRVVDLLDRSTERALTELEDRPEVQARLLLSLGRAHFSLWNYEQARDLWTRSLALSASSGAEADPEVVRSLGEVAVELGDWEGADTLLAAALAGARAGGRDTTAARVRVLQARSALYRDEFTTAAAALDDAVPALRRLGPPTDLAGALYLRAGLRHETGDLDGAIADQREGLEMFRALRGDDAQAAVGWTNLGVLHRTVGNLEAADSAFAEALRLHAGRTPEGATPVIALLTEYANLLSTRGETARADSLYRLAVSRAEAAENGGRLLLVVLANLAQHRRRSGDAEGALVHARRSVEVAEALYGGEAPALAPVLTGLALALDAVADSAAAEAAYGRALELLSTAGPAASAARQVAERGVARGWSRAGRHAEAESALRRLLDANPPGSPPTSAAARGRAATLLELEKAYRRAGRGADADAVRAIRESEAAGGAGGGD